VLIGVLACSKRKLDRPAPARDLYTGDVFRAARAVLERRGCERLVILSGRYGAVDGATVLAPYDHYLRGCTAVAHALWTDATHRQLADLVPAGATVFAIVPNLYATALERLEHERLFAGLSLPRLKHALRLELEARAA
jgi:hypothetical protein